MQISVSSTLTVFHNGQFWVGLAERVEEGRYGVARIVFGDEPTDEEILRFVASKWAKLSFFGKGPRPLFTCLHSSVPKGSLTRR